MFSKEMEKKLDNSVHRLAWPQPNRKLKKNSRNQPNRYEYYVITVEPVLSDHIMLLAIKNVVSQDRWSLMTGSITLKCLTCQEYLIFQGKWSLVIVVSQYRFHCIQKLILTYVSLIIFYVNMLYICIAMFMILRTK